MTQSQPKQSIIRTYGVGAFLKFLIPSIVGAALFLIPVPTGESFSVSIGIIIDVVQTALGAAFLNLASLIIIIISAVGAIFYKLVPKEKRSGLLKVIFDTTPLYLIFRVLGAILAVLTYFQWGPEMVWSADTGGTMLLSLVPTLVVNFLLCGFLLPFLLDFGSMDYIGILIRNIMRPLFTIPGRSSLDCLASFVGNGTVGVVITSKQYDEGYYTGREASVIATCFSIVSIPFCLTIANFLNVGHYFFPMYMTIVVACVVLAIVTPRIYPLRRIPDTYNPEVGKRIVEQVPEGISRHQWALKQGIERAQKNASWGSVAYKGIETVLDIWISLLPIVMFGGTVALIIAEYTPFFTIISYPFTFLLEWMKIPFAAEAAPGVVAGFADMFLPAILGAGIESEMTRFFIAVLSLCQLIFVTENVMILLKSKIPINFGHLVIIFLERTIITIPIAALAAHLLF